MKFFIIKYNEPSRKMSMCGLVLASDALVTPATAWLGLRNTAEILSRASTQKEKRGRQSLKGEEE